MLTFSLMEHSSSMKILFHLIIIIIIIIIFWAFYICIAYLVHTYVMLSKKHTET